MKKILLIAMMACTALAASAQKSLYLSTYMGTDIQKYDGQTMRVKTTRMMFNGWNTMCVPFSMTNEDLQKTFGDVRVVSLVGAQDYNDGVALVFDDVKEIEANKPYLIYYGGDNKVVSLNLVKQLAYATASEVSYTTESGVVVRMAGANKQTASEGLYGILVKDNKDAKFSAVGGVATNGFYATRCYVELSNGTNTPLYTAFGDVTGISELAAKENAANADVYSINGVKTNAMHKGVIISNGKKILVK